METRITTTWEDTNGDEWVVTFTEDADRQITAYCVSNGGKPVPLSKRPPLLRILNEYRRTEATAIVAKQWEDSTGRTWTAHGNLTVGDDSPPPRRYKMTRSHYEKVATIYAGFFREGAPDPTQQTHIFWNEQHPERQVDRKTIDRWIAQCRTDKGFNLLDKTDKGRAKGPKE